MQVTYDGSMGYQALLFCPDEKNARVVRQVLSELDFAVEIATESFAAVKKLMAQHFDALVVDCENEQNASLLFKSARNSSANQSSLAVAVVEGQAGVAKAFRIGANLVLTKPINVEQSKGTLRVARGLLRKGSDAGKTAVSHGGATASEPAVSGPSKLQRPKATLVPGLPLTRPPLAPVSSLGLGQEMTAGSPSAQAAGPGAINNPALAAPGSALQKRLAPQAYIPEAFSEGVKASTVQDTAGGRQPDAAAPIPNPPFISTVSRGAGTAAAAAPGRELPSSLIAALEASSNPSSSVPTFGSVDTSEGKEKSFWLTRILAIVAVISVIAIAAYFGYKHGNRDQDTVAPTTSETEPMTPPAPATVHNSASAASPVRKLNSEAQPSAGKAQPNSPPAKPSPSSKNVSSEPIAEDTTVTLEEVEPMKVKSDLAQPAHPKAASPADQALPPAPGALNIAVSNSDEKALSTIVATAPVSLPKPTPGILNISQGVTQGMVIKRVQPTYPPQALSMRLQGAVQLQATISKDGSITNVKVLSGDGILARAAADAVRQWKYNPYYLNGEPVEIQTEITVNFKLPN